MLFNSFQFALFFALVLAAVVALPRRLEPRVLLAASLVFYALWIPSFVAVLLAVLGVNYGLLRLVARSARPDRYLGLSIAFTLSVLALFKYGPLVPAAAGSLLGVAHPARSFFSSLVLPLGISFYAFEIVSVAVDVRRGKLPCPSFSRYLLFVTFFPHLIAGPILRGGELLPQLEAGGERTAARRRRGGWLFVTGLVKKTVFSDYLLLNFVTGVFGAPGTADGPTHLVAMYSFAFQIYFDFSGYSDMARGIACLLGYELPLNFEEPYLSRDPSEFWRRWHATLSRWLRDYLYLPLGGNRQGKARTAVNLLLTMCLGGAWHGAGVNFLVWGFLHGVVLVLYRFAGRRGDETRPLAWSDAPAVVLMFHLVCLLWIPFRAATWGDTQLFVRGLLSGGYLGSWPIVPLAIVFLCGLVHAFERWARRRLPALHLRLATTWWGPAFEGLLSGSCVAASILASGAGVQFIYFQF